MLKTEKKFLLSTGEEQQSHDWKSISLKDDVLGWCCVRVRCLQSWSSWSGDSPPDWGPERVRGGLSSGRKLLLPGEVFSFVTGHLSINSSDCRTEWLRKRPYQKQDGDGWPLGLGQSLEAPASYPWSGTEYHKAGNWNSVDYNDASNLGNNLLALKVEDYRL